MPVKLNVKTRIKINGKEYASPEEMPPEARRLYDQALAKGGTSTPANLKSKITFNGKSYNSPDEMPETTRRIYEGAIRSLDKGHEDISGSLQKGGSRAPSNSRFESSPTQPHAIQPDNPNNAPFIIVVTVCILIIVGLAILLVRMLR